MNRRRRRAKAAIYADESWFKLARRQFQSSVWEEDLATRIVWITLVHLAQLPENRKHGHGLVMITRSNLGRYAFVTAEQLEHALSRLAAPDPTSRTEPDKGRIDVLPNGYRIRSFELYHDVEEFDAWRAQRVAAGKARAANARRADGRFASEKPATAGNEPAKPLVSTRKTERRGDGDGVHDGERNGTETDAAPAEPSESLSQPKAQDEREELVTVCRAIARRQRSSITDVVRKVSSIEPSNGHGFKSFGDPRKAPLPWVRTALARARELATELERPLPQ